MVQLAHGGWRPGVLLQLLLCSGRPLKTRVHPSVTSVRVENPAFRPKADFVVDHGTSSLRIISFKALQWIIVHPEDRP